MACVSAVGLLAQGVPPIVTLVAVGRLGIVPLASVSLASVLVYNVCETLWIGISLGHGALAAQAVGARNYTAAYGWTALALMTGIATGLLLTPFFFVGHLIIGLATAGAPEGDGFDTELARQYLWASAPVPLIAGLSHALSGHLSAVQRVSIVATIDVVEALIDVAATLLLVLGADAGGGWSVPRLGAAGAGYANVVSQAIRLLLTMWAFARWSMPPPNAADADDELLDDALSEQSDGDVDADIDSRAMLDPLLLADTRLSTAADKQSTTLVGVAADSSSDPCASRAGGATAASDVVGSETTHESAVASVSAGGVARFACELPHMLTFAVQVGGATASLALELGADVAIAFLAAGLGGTAAAVNNTSGAVFETLNMVLFSAFQTTSVRLAHFLGAGRLVAAQRVGLVAGAASVVWLCAVSTALLASRSIYGHVFSDDAAVVSGITALMPIFVVVHAVFAVYIYFCSILDGQGRATAYPGISLLAAVVMLPLAVASAKATALGVNGLWGAIGIGFAVASVAAGAFVYRSDWKQLAALARTRNADATV